MKNIFKFIYNKKDNGIYRIITILGIRIITKPIELKLLKRQKKCFTKFKSYFSLLNKFNKSIVLANFYNIPIENNPSIAVFGVLPPEKTGIANCNAKIFGINSYYEVFSDFKSFSHFITAEKYINDNYKNNFFPIEYFYKYKNNYDKKIFVLGNSYHNIRYLDYAIEEKDKKNSYLYFHEANSLNLIYSYTDCSVRKFKEIIINYYPSIYNKINCLKNKYQIIQILQKEKIYGIKIILQFTNIKNIIVNNDKCKELIINETKETNYYNKINIIKMFHPIEKLNKENIKKQYKKLHDNIYIGSFGYLDSVKGSDTVIKVINILNKKCNNKIKLVVSGYNAKNYINTIKDKTLTENIICFETKNTEDFISLMDSVDMAIQLRNNPQGESSGVICQLLALNKKIITTKGFVSKELSKSVREVKPFISAEELTLEILDYLEDKTIIDNSELIEKYSFENLSNKLLEL